MRTASVLLLVAGCFLASAQYAGRQPIPERYKSGTDAIQIATAKQDLTFLATQCDGRGTGQPGFFRAADYIAEKFKEAGLKPVGDGGTYFQHVPFFHYGIDATQSYLASGDGTTKVVGPQNISFGRLGTDVDQTAPALIIRARGADAQVQSVDALKSKIVIVISDSDSTKLRRQLVNQGAVALVWVRQALDPGLGTVSRNKGGGDGDLNDVEVAPDAAKRLCEALTGNDDGMDTSKTSPNTADEIDPKSSLRMVAKGSEEPLGVPNVVGLLEGSDPKLKKEIVGIGAHLDHLGRNGSTVYPGADDDGSGSTAVLEIVDAFKAGRIKPKRSILFMTFCGEEMGLLGSGYYSDHPIFPHDEMIAELQMDMVGRDSEGPQNGDANRVDKKADNVDTIRLVGSKRISTDLDKLIEADNKYVGFRFKWDAEDVYERSDHYNFAKHGIPIAFLFDGFHPDYHRPTDTVDKIDWVKLTNAAKLYYIVALDLANNPTPPRHDVLSGG